MALSLAKNSGVKTLDVSINDMGDLGAIALLGTSVSSLNMAGNHLGDNGLKMLGDNKTLNSLFIHENKLTDQSISFLLASQSLLEVVLDNNALTPEGIETVFHHIQENVLLHIQALVEQFAPYVSVLSSQQKLIIKEMVDVIFTKDDLAGDIVGYKGGFFATAPGQVSSDVDGGVSPPVL